MQACKTLTVPRTVAPYVRPAESARTLLLNYKLGFTLVRARDSPIIALDRT
jgi:hypothetical protein